MKYTDLNHTHLLYKYTASIKGVIRGDRLKNRIAREQHEECNEFVSNQGYESGGRSNRTVQK